MKYLTVSNFVWIRWGLKRFTAEVDAAQNKGWIMDGKPEYRTGLLGLRWLCVAYLSRAEE